MGGNDIVGSNYELVAASDRGQGYLLLCSLFFQYLRPDFLASAWQRSQVVRFWSFGKLSTCLLQPPLFLDTPFHCSPQMVPFFNTSILLSRDKGPHLTFSSLLLWWS